MSTANIMKSSISESGSLTGALQTLCQPFGDIFQYQVIFASTGTVLPASDARLV